MMKAGCVNYIKTRVINQIMCLLIVRAAVEKTKSMTWRLKLTLRGAATVLFFSSTDADVGSAAGAGAEVEIEGEPLSLLTLPLLSTTAGVSLSFFLLSVLTMGWS